MLGMASPTNAKHQGIIPGKTIDSTVEAAMACIEAKAIKQRIMTAKP
jgi:hypothetical protein